VPSRACDAVSDSGVRAIAEWIGTAFLAREAPRMGVVEGIRLNLSLQDGALQQLRYAARALLTPGLGEWSRWSLPRHLEFLYWPLRLARLAEKYLLRRIPAAATPRTPPPPRRSTG
jgi:hypothetical protein